ncbi:hypothetical protein [Actinokineospora globicatena]|uniref:hypothetical protein n=1 Tax=Actinokineospora globicatena TaxID=103729 RepID=UPI0020A53143|nr:hypothetical protein [Actinokineospora globicatena]MCP2304753.1 hypothetical protein [Actinokineospora globicatena]GLW77871.1 hypothetical protein Aglo01_23530 [Actinokineospora globicatena]GLW85461.1 hypothetical protein Aglo02_31010 [Actinokineospora globicatena]
MTSRWAFVAALATTGALLLRHPAPPGAVGGWGWLVLVAATAALVALWRFPGRAWPWVLVVGGALSTADAVLWVDNWPLPPETSAAVRLQVVSVITSVAAVLLLLGALGGAGRLLAVEHRAHGAALAGIAVGAFTASGPLARSRFEPSIWDLVPFVAAGLAVAGGAAAVLVSRRDSRTTAGPPWVLAAGVLAVAASALPELDDRLRLVSVIALVGLAALTAVRATLETTALVVVAVVGIALVRAGIRLDGHPVGARPSVLAWLALVGGVLVFAAFALTAVRALLFTVTATAAGLVLPVFVDDGSGYAMALLGVGAGLVVLAGSVVAERCGDSPLVVVVLGLAGASAGPLGDLGLGNGVLLDNNHPTWWVTLALVAAAALVATGAAMERYGTRSPITAELSA